MIEKLQEQLGNLNKREKIIMGVTGISLLFYISYAVVFQSVYGKIMKSMKELAVVGTEHADLKTKSGKLKQLAALLKTNDAILAKVEKEEKAFKESLQARNQIGNFLQTLESTARGLPMQLVNLNSKTNLITKTGNYKKQAGPASEGAGASQAVRVTYSQNIIDLKYRSDYYSGVEFISKVLELPYTVSIVSVEMTPSESSGEDSNSGTGVDQIDTMLTMEIFFR